MRALLIAGLASASIAHANGETFPFDIPSMVEQAEAAGIAHVYDGPWEYFVGGGAASFDCNGDRMPDVFLAGGASPAGLYVNRSETAGPLRFHPQTLPVRDALLRKVTGAYPVNLDNDAHIDLVVLRVGRNLILKGGPECRFTDASAEMGLSDDKAWTTGFSAIWEQGAQFPTLAFGNYVDRRAPGSPWGTCEPNALIRPAAGEQPDYTQATLLEPGYCSLSMLFTDWNGSGEPSLRITNDRQYYRGGQEQLWHVPPGTAPRAYAEAEGWRRLMIWGMGIAEGDPDGDGRPDYALTSMGDTKLQTLDAEADEDQPVYRDIAFDLGATAHRPYMGDDSKPSTGWHAQFADLNNDARQDLFSAKGNVEAMPDFAEFDPDNMLLRGPDGYVEAGEAAGIALPTKGRGAVVEDFNADGMLDLLVVNRGAPASLFRNQGTAVPWGHRRTGNWLAVELDHGAINPDAVGAVISVRTGNLNQTRVVQVGGGHASGQSGFVHFGLGVAERATVRVKWPDGNWSHPFKVFANNFTIITRGDAQAGYWYPRQ